MQTHLCLPLTLLSFGLLLTACSLRESGPAENVADNLLAGSCTATTYEAETMTHSTGGATTGGWNIWSNGYISTNHTFLAGQTTLTVTASGEVAAGVWPHMVVSVGGVSIGSANVSSTSWTTYSFSFNASAGTQEVRVTFDNDLFANGQDRNLLVDKVVVGCPPPPGCNGSTGIAISTPLALDKSTVEAGQTVTGTATYTNCSNAPLSLQQIIIGGRPPGGTHAGGPYDDFSPVHAAVSLAVGGTVTITASRAFTSADPAGTWVSFVTYQDTSGAWHDGPDVQLAVTASGGGGLPTGWLYTSGNRILVSNGAGGGTGWMGRGVNVSDAYLCGANSNLSMSNVDQVLESTFTGLMRDWKPNFLRVSLSMHSYLDENWVTNDARYTTPTTNAINFLGGYANTYVLVTLRSHSSMVETNSGNEATYLPTNATDATYQALVDTFANSKFVMFGLCNEPGTIAPASLVPVMSHAVSVIRAEEDRLGVPHHIVSVQGRNWTSDISFYASSPLPYDNVVYEVHGYEPTASMYTYSNIPVIMGEYGPANASDDGTISSSVFTDFEAKQIPNIAWNFEPYSDCSPSLVSPTRSSTNLVPTTWGSQVKSYLLSHAP